VGSINATPERKRRKPNKIEYEEEEKKENKEEKIEAENEEKKKEQAIKKKFPCLWRDYSKENWPQC
jgi:hypothetical protein